MCPVSSFQSDLSFATPVNPQSCLPVSWQSENTQITPVAAGLSGAGVYRVEHNEQLAILKIAEPYVDPTFWQNRLTIRQMAADAGLAPRVLHVDTQHHAVLSEYVADQGFAIYYSNPTTHQAALKQLGQALRRLHDLSLPVDSDTVTPLRFLSRMQAALPAGFQLPNFVKQAFAQAQSLDAPSSGRSLVLSHNDVNPTNLVWDGKRLMLLDWDSAGANEPTYDLAAIAMFMRMDPETCLILLSAYEGRELSELPPRFGYDRKLVGLLCGAAFLHLVSQSGFAGAEVNVEDALDLGGFYLRLQTGELKVSSPEGQWQFGLALIKESLNI